MPEIVEAQVIRMVFNIAVTVPALCGWFSKAREKVGGFSKLVPKPINRTGVKVSKDIP